MRRRKKHSKKYFFSVTGLVFVIALAIIINVSLLRQNQTITEAFGGSSAAVNKGQLGSLTVNVTDTAGKKVNNATVTLHGKLNPCYPTCAKVVIGTAVTKSGEASFKNLTSGLYSITIEDEKKNLTTDADVFWIYGGEPLTLNRKLVKTAAPQALLTWTTTSPGRPRGSTPGAPVTFVIKGTDADGSVVSYRLNYGDGTSSVVSAKGGTFTHTYTKPGDYWPTATVTDNNGRTLLASYQPGLPFLPGKDIRVVDLRVSTLPSFIVISSTPTTVNLTGAITVDLVDDPYSGIVSYTWDFGDGSAPLTTPVEGMHVGSVSANASHVYVPGTYTARLSALEGDAGAQAGALTTVTVKVE